MIGLLRRLRRRLPSMTDVIQVIDGPYGMVSRVNWTLRGRLAIIRGQPPLRTEPICPRCGMTWHTDRDAYNCCMKEEDEERSV